MGFVSRFSTLVKSKASRLLDRAEDPRETLDYAEARTMFVEEGLLPD
jgi:phage shock protein A